MSSKYTKLKYHSIPILNVMPFLKTHKERTTFINEKIEWSFTRLDYYEKKKLPLQSSVKFLPLVLGKHNYTIQTYRKYLIWETPDFRIIANDDYGFDMEIREDLMKEKNLLNILKIWDDVRLKFINFVNN